MIKIGQVYVNPLSGVERTIINVDRKEDTVVLKWYDERFGTLYSRWTFKQLKEEYVLKEETKWQSMN